MGTAFKLKNGSLLLVTEAPGGIYNSEQLQRVASLADSETAIVKVTEDQRLALFASEESAAEIAASLRAVGLGIRHYQDGLHQPGSCIGKLCPEALQDALGSAMKVTDVLSVLKTRSPLKIGINGCARCCVPCHTLDIAIVGADAGYSISLGGKNNQVPEVATLMAQGVPGAELPGILEKIIGLFNEIAEPGESLQAVMARAGVSRFAALMTPYSQDGLHSDSDFFSPDPLSKQKGELATDMEADKAGQDLSASQSRQNELSEGTIAPERLERENSGEPFGGEEEEEEEGYDDVTDYTEQEAPGSSVPEPGLSSEDPLDFDEMDLPPEGSDGFEEDSDEAAAGFDQAEADGEQPDPALQSDLLTTDTAEDEAEFEERLKHDIDDSRSLHQPDENEDDRDAALRSLTHHPEAVQPPLAATDEGTLPPGQASTPGACSESIAGVECMPGGKLRLRFSSGICLLFDPASLSAEKKYLAISGQRIALYLAGDEAQVEFEDGLIMSLPATAA